MYDSCRTYSAATWNTIFSYSPHNLRGLGFYLGGKTADAQCFEPPKSWIDSLNSGWYLVPIWDGLQAPCASGLTYDISTDPDTAYNQGINSGDNAKIVMNQLGFTNGIVYLDLEPYPASCENVVGKYIGGFVREMHALGFQAGVYASACYPDFDYYRTLNNVPNDSWISWPNGIDSASTSGSDPCVSSTNWINHHRIHQYDTDQNVTWGGATVYVDKDCSDGDTNDSIDLNLTCG